MATHLSNYCRNRRIERGLTPGQLARLLGYRNVNKGIRRLLRFEREGSIKEDLLVRLAEALEIDLPIIEELIEQDRAERLRQWEAWVNEQVPMTLIVRYLPGGYGQLRLPANIATSEDAIAYARQVARKRNRRVCLVISRRLSVWIDAQGDVEATTEAMPERPNEPFLAFEGSTKRFLLNFQVS
jgi:transcriptional regulator with XRE-family HTH domain